MFNDDTPVEKGLLTARQFDSYDTIIKKMQANWRGQLTIIVVALSYLYRPEQTQDLLGFFKIPVDTFKVFVAYTLPISFIYFGFYLGRYAEARDKLETMLIADKVAPNKLEATKLTDGLFIFDVTHRLILFKLPLVQRATLSIGGLFVVAVVTCNHVLSFQYALHADLFPITVRYLSNTLLLIALLLCYLHFIFQLPKNGSRGYQLFCIITIISSIISLLLINTNQ